MTLTRVHGALGRHWGPWSACGQRVGSRGGRLAARHGRLRWRRYSHQWRQQWRGASGHPLHPAQYRRRM